MNIFNLNATKRLIDIFNYNNQEQNTLLSCLTWLQTIMKIDWIHGVLLEYDTRLDLVYLSNRGSLLYIYFQKFGGVYKLYEDNVFETFKDFDNFIKINRYILFSKYEGIQNVASLDREKIISIINFFPEKITSFYLQNICDIIVEYLDTKNKLETITDTYYVFRNNMTQSNNNLLRMCSQKEDEKKALTKMINETKELLKIKSI
jgi:hypothetical protein